MATVQGSSASPDIFAGLGLGQAAGKKASSTAEAQDRFMKLLVTQIRNQDPLNPMDNAQMTSQLAQISTVDGIEKLNTAIQKLVGFYEGGQAMQATGMIGKHVMVPGNEMQLTNAGGFAGFELAGSADQVKVNILDSNSLLMRTMELGPAAAGSGNFFWDGMTDGGVPAVNGTYRVLLEATRGGEPVGSKELSIGTVNAITRTGNGYEFDLGEKGAFRFDDIRQIL